MGKLMVPTEVAGARTGVMDGATRPRGRGQEISLYGSTKKGFLTLWFHGPLRDGSASYQVIDMSEGGSREISRYGSKSDQVMVLPTCQRVEVVPDTWTGRQGVLGAYPGGKGMATGRRRFTAAFRKRVALEALGDANRFVPELQTAVDVSMGSVQHLPWRLWGASAFHCLFRSGACRRRAPPACAEPDRERAETVATTVVHPLPKSSAMAERRAALMASWLSPPFGLAHFWRCSR